MIKLFQLLSSCEPSFEVACWVELVYCSWCYPLTNFNTLFLNAQWWNVSKFIVKSLQSKQLLRALLKAIGLRRCSKWFGQVSGRDAESLTNRWFCSQHDLIHGLWNDARRRSDCWLIGPRLLPFIRSAISIRHCSEFILISRTTLHRGSLRVPHKWVCGNVRTGAAIKQHV